MLTSFGCRKFMPLLALALYLVGTSPSVASESALEELRLTAGDELSNDKKALQAEVLVRKSEDLALQQIKDLLRKHRGTGMEVELLFRLAELHMRRSKTERFFEVHRESATIARLAPNRVKKASQKREVQQAINTYNRIRKSYPSYQQMDLVLFNTGFALQLINKDLQAAKVYWEIVKNHSGSHLVPDAHLAIGEINFEQRKYSKALEHFLMIEKYPQSRAFSYGMYKASWAYYNLQNAADAMKKLEQVVQHGQYVKDNGLDARLDLRAEALQDLALFYSDVLTAKGAVDYFMRQSRELDSWPYISTLTEIYKRHGKYSDVELVLLDVIKRVPEKKAIIEAHNELVWNHEKMLSRDKAVDRLQVFVKYCKSLRPREKNPAPEAQEPSDLCKERIVESSHQLASKWHGLWIKNNKHELFEKTASEAYQAYLEFADPSTEEMAQVRYNYGELLFNGKAYRKASESYALVRSAAPSPQLLHDGNYGAIVSLERAVEDKWSDQDESQFQSLVRTYLADTPSGQYALDLKFKVAFIAYQKGRYDEAMPQLQKLGWENPKTERGEKAQDLFLDILNIQKKYGELKKASFELQAMASSAARKSKIKNIYQQAYFAEIQTDAEQGQGLESAASFFKFAEENPASELAPKAWWNAIQILFKQDSIAEGSSRCLEMAKKFPKDEKVKECLGYAAHHFEQMGKLEDAANALERIAAVSEGINQKKTKELAADFHALSGNAARADKLYEEISTGLSNEEMSRLLEKWHLFALDSGLSARASYLRGRIMAHPSSPYKYELLAEEVENLFDRKKFSEAFQKALEVVGSSSASGSTKAKARLHQALILQDEFNRQSVRARPERIALVLSIKTEKLEKAQQAFQATISYKDPEHSLKALEGLAQIYLTYAKDLRSMDLPADVGEEARMQFKADLESIAIPMEEKGIEGVQQALRFSKDIQLRDASVFRLQNWLNELNHQAAATEPSTIQPGPYLPQGGGV